MRRDQLKILLSGILVLLLGSLIVYSYLFREDISKFLKKKESEEVSNNSKIDRVILSPDVNSESHNDLNTLPTEKKVPGEFSNHESESLPPNKAVQEDWAEETKQGVIPEEKLREETNNYKNVNKGKAKEKTQEVSTNVPKEETNVYKEEPKKERMKDWENKFEKVDRKTERRFPKKSKMKNILPLKLEKNSILRKQSGSFREKIRNFSYKEKHKTHKVDRKSLEKRVQKLEREMERLKTKE
ncbi:hypothetical protein LEP1GSC116_4045 [Leptospira interrogans serovar Icterohaemorrhagiae str. Verdun HP]|uniref:Uncharacterized protein n=1 Tax=Leptospira interrogans serovar Icterohaemorrhagiae str. Verdun HP TaxID=1049910 RepID=M6RP61_LEPIR|nr:hypothetical protein LEP1GSC116_4045 [Leptospira interrogans serovar Icterohaemorrhagiae str. Verdun HP]